MILGGIKKAWSGLRLRRLDRRYGERPDEYWDARHQIYGDGLHGVGFIGGDDARNQVDYDEKLRRVSDVVAGLRDEGAASALDAGCGTGVFTGLLLSKGFDVTAIDFSPTSVTMVRERFPELRDAAVSSLSGYASSEGFDLVMCIDVLFHVVDDDEWRRSVENLERLVVPGGALVIQEHLVAPSDERRDLHTRWRSLESYRTALRSSLESHDHYELPAEGNTKDLLVWRRPPR